MPKIDKVRAKKRAAPRAAKAKWEAARVRARVERHRRQYVAAKRAQAPEREMLSKLRSLDAEDDQLASFHIVDGQMNLLRIRARRLLGMMKDQIATSDDHSYEYHTRVEFKFLWNQIASDQNEKRRSQINKQHGQKGAKSGFKGGRPRKKPFGFKFREEYEKHLADCGDDPREARARLVKELMALTGVKARTARDWVKEAGI